MSFGKIKEKTPSSNLLGLTTYLDEKEVKAQKKEVKYPYLNNTNVVSFPPDMVNSKYLEQSTSKIKASVVQLDDEGDEEEFDNIDINNSLNTKEEKVENIFVQEIKVKETKSKNRRKVIIENA